MAERGTIIVTGGSRGIGAATCKRLGADGYAILVNYAKDAEGAARVVADLKAGGARAYAFKANVSDEAQVAGMFAAADRELGPLAALVNNAGVLGSTGRVDECDVANLQEVLSVNVVGAMICAKHAIRRLSTRHGGDGGAIVNVGSIAATTGGIPGMVAYAASKGAITSFTIALAKEVAREGIRVNAVAPGMIVTDMTESVAAQVGPMIPIGRCGDPPEIAAAIAWLVSDAASYAVGSVLTVSGGR
jgi:NAD(P)-dependent dehydrogenase (short-subunit alcohol dehydrogenase family)